MKLSTATGATPKEFYTEKERFEAIAEAGFRYVNFDFFGFSAENPYGADYMSDEWESVAKNYLERMKAAGLTPIMAHGPYLYPRPDELRQPMIDAANRAIESCAVMNIPHIVMHPHARLGMSYDEFMTENCAFFKELIPAAEKTGVMVLIENIGQTSDPHFVRNGVELRRLIESAEHPLFGACWDTGHANHIMNDQCDSIRTLGSLLKGLHINDNMGDVGKPWINDMHTFPTFGTVDFDGVVRTLKEIGYAGYFNFETIKPGGRAFKEGDKMADFYPNMRKHGLKLLYNLGKCMLEAYDCFEE